MGRARDGDRGDPLPVVVCLDQDVGQQRPAASLKGNGRYGRGVWCWGRPHRPLRVCFGRPPRCQNYGHIISCAIKPIGWTKTEVPKSPAQKSVSSRGSAPVLALVVGNDREKHRAPIAAAIERSRSRIARRAGDAIDPTSPNSPQAVCPGCFPRREISALR